MFKNALLTNRFGLHQARIDRKLVIHLNGDSSSVTSASTSAQVPSMPGIFSPRSLESSIKSTPFSTAEAGKPP